MFYGKNSKYLKSEDRITDLIKTPGSEESGYSTAKFDRISTFFQRRKSKPCLDLLKPLLIIASKSKLKQKKSIKILEIYYIKKKELHEKVSCSKTSKEEE